MKHACMIPLIGGEAIASTAVFGSKPEYIMSYSPFQANEKHLLNYWENSVPYYLIDQGHRPPAGKIDVVSSVCPCAGLSQMSFHYGDDNQNNRWMIESSKFVLSEVRPEVYFGENAPGLAGKIGENVRKQLIQIGSDNGYTMSLYRTKSLLHGVPQVRERAFYFFWKGDRTPLLEYYNRPYEKIEDLITSVRSNTLTEPINSKRPTEDPYYRYLLEVIYGGISHREHFDKIDIHDIKVRSNDAKSLIEHHGHDYRKVGAWMQEKGFDREAVKCERMFNKLASGGNIMRRGTILPKDHIGAFVGHYPTMLAHPYEDRYISYREALTIMGMPVDFELLDPKNSVNHICQNVPVPTAIDIATEVEAVLNDERHRVDSPLVFQSNHTRSHVTYGSSKTVLEFFN